MAKQKLKLRHDLVCGICLFNAYVLTKQMPDTYKNKNYSDWIAIKFVKKKLSKYKL